MQITATRDWANSYSLAEKYFQLLPLWDVEGDTWENIFILILFLLPCRNVLFMAEKYKSQDHVSVFLAVSNESAQKVSN